MKYTSFNKATIRTPMLPINSIKALLEAEVVNDDDLINQFKNPLINDAIYLASPDLYYGIEKWKTGKLNDENKIKRLKVSFLKYVVRICFRSTPFGLFSAVSTLSVSNNPTNVRFDNVDSFTRHNRLNPIIISDILLKFLEKDSVFRSSRFFTNTSIYRFKNRFRYFESVRDSGKVEYEISEIESNQYLEEILRVCKYGRKKNEIVNLLHNNGISLENATDYINELIKNDVLVSEISPTIEGDSLRNLICFCKTNKIEEECVIYLEEINLILDSIKIEIYESEINQNKYKKIIKILEKLEIKTKYKNLIFTDTYHSKKSSIVNLSFFQEIESLLKKIYYISEPDKGEELKELSKNIYDFLDHTNTNLNLHMLFDPAYDIQTDKSIDHLNHPLLSGIDLDNNFSERTSKQINLTSFQTKIITKILSKNSERISLHEGDFIKKENHSAFQLPDTFSVFTSFIKDKDKIKIVFNNSGGSSAANILSRFSYDEKIYDLIKSIIEKEEAINSDKILAEFLYFPAEERIRYIMNTSKPIRKYRIPYLCSVDSSKADIIDINELYISVDIHTQEVKLKSKNHDKEILPMITNSHNTSHFSSLPIHKFFGELKIQGRKYGLGVHLDSILDIFGYIPRIEYKNIILQKAKWLIDEEDLIGIKNKKYDENSSKLRVEMKLFKKKYSLPEYVIFKVFDQSILINLQNTSSFLVFLDSIKINVPIILEEFFENSPFINEEGDEYLNEVIMHFYKYEE